MAPPEPANRKPLRLAVLISGGGRTLQNFAEKIQAGELAAEIVLVVSSHAGAGGLDRARRLGLPHRAIDYREFRRETGDGFSRAVTEAVEGCGAELAAMAGFTRLWRFPASYRHRVMNIHPALLPAFGGKGFYGDRVHRAVIESAAKFSGCTVHFADQEYDRGPIILQRVIPVLPGETPHSLADRVFTEECVAYPEAIGYFAEDRLEIRGSRVIIRPAERMEEKRNRGPAT